MIVAVTVTVIGSGEAPTGIDDGAVYTPALEMPPLLGLIVQRTPALEPVTVAWNACCPFAFKVTVPGETLMVGVGAGPEGGGAGGVRVTVADADTAGFPIDVAVMVTVC